MVEKKYAGQRKCFCLIAQRDIFRITFTHFFDFCPHFMRIKFKRNSFVMFE